MKMKNTFYILLLTASLQLQSFLASDEHDPKNNPPISYGADISWPHHHRQVSSNYAWLPHNIDPKHYPVPSKYQDMPIQPLGDRQAFYETFLESCEKYYKEKKGQGLCSSTEENRIYQSLKQPSSMQNYTDIGFKKIRTPERVWKIIQSFWEMNKAKMYTTQEVWGKGNTYTNNWESPTYMVSVENTQLRGGGENIKAEIWNAARETISEWTNQELTECSLYGIRVYTNGSVLAPHVDRLPLVSSAIVNVAQDVDEPWPLEVIGHDGKAYNVTMEPGDMVLYESHSVIHGRPFPLKGRFYANIFIHFEPTGHSLRHNANIEMEDPTAKYRKAIQDRHGGHENNHEGLPPYILEDSEEGRLWHQNHPDNQRSAEVDSFSTGTTAAHEAASTGDVDILMELIEQFEDLIRAKDENGWEPLHEGIRSGHLDVVELLIKKGADVNERTLDGEGDSPLRISLDTNGPDHPVTEYLLSLGAIDVGPDL